MSIAEKFVAMEYGPAPEDPKEAAKPGSTTMAAASDISSVAPGNSRRQAAYFETTDPSTGEKLADVAQGSAADIDAAVRAASAALPKWQALTPHVRARYLYALARTIQKHSRRLAVLETMDNGKPIRESRDIDIPLVIRALLSSRGLGAIAGAGISGLHSLRRSRTNHPVELSAAHAGLEDRSRTRYRQHGCP